MAQQPLYALKVYEEPYAVSDVAREKWEERLSAAAPKICVGIARAFGITNVTEENACDAVANIPPEEFQRRLAEPAVRGWQEFFNVTEENYDAYIAAMKMRAKLSTAASLYATRVSNALKTYFADRVTQSVEKWVERMITIRFVGDPPHTPYGPAPYLALRITGEVKAGNYAPPHAEEQGAVDNYVDPRLRMYTRAILVPILVQHGVIAKYFIIAGVEEGARTVLDNLKLVAQRILDAFKRQDVSITFDAGYEQVDFMDTPAIYFAVTVAPAASTGG